ncbi:FAD-dependent oxidoreductase [Massilia kyonggiensis]|nr:FAD-dependent oxidoreductase [Massilia kyonggiensis]
MDFDTDVLICGAGAAGLTLALDLARRGVPFRLVERQDAPFHGSRGKGIQPRTLEVFEDLGIVDRAVALGGPYPPQRVYAVDGSDVQAPLAAEPAATSAEPYGTPLMLPQSLTEQVMRDRLLELGQRVESGLALTDLAQEEDGVTVTLAGGGGESRLRARYVVGTDGGRSTVRRLLDIGFPGKTMNVRALVADVALKGLDRDAWHRFNGDDMARRLEVCPLAGTDLFQIQAPVPPDGDVDLSAQALDAMVKDRTGRGDVHVAGVSWASAYTMNARLADRYRVGRVFLAGDAAHTHPPTGGQGLNTSVQDAYNLGWKLAAVLAGAPDDLLDTYEAERRPVAAAMLQLSTALLDAARRGGEMRRGREVRQLDLAYPDSPLSFAQPARTHGVRAGDRAPDAVVLGAGGQPVRLFTLFAGPHWTLLGRDVAPGVADALRRPGLRVHLFGARGDVIDVHGQVQAAYGLGPGELVLVRPDGYVGAIAASAHADALAAYMRRAGLS